MYSSTVNILYLSALCLGKDHNEPKRWKANFRCALHSLKDVIALKNLSQKRGNDPFMVYELLPERPRKSSLRSEHRFFNRLTDKQMYLTL